MWWNKKKKKVILSDSVEQTDFNNKLKDIGLSDEAISMLNEREINGILDFKYKEDLQTMEEKDYKKPNPNLEINYRDVYELAQKLIIAKGTGSALGYHHWAGCVDMATYIYFHYDDVIESVNRYLHENNKYIEDMVNDYLDNGIYGNLCRKTSDRTESLHGSAEWNRICLEGR